MRLRSCSPGEASTAHFRLERNSSHRNSFILRLIYRFISASAVLCGVAAISSPAALAQNSNGDPSASPVSPSSSSQPPDAPAAQNSADERAPQTKRILGIIPNFRSVSTDEKLPPQTVKEKFMDATEDSFDYSSIFIPAMLAAASQASNSYPEFGQGALGYGRYFWRAAIDQTDENYMVEFVVPVITREDTRYYTLGRGGFFKRTAYAMSRAVITRSDSGHTTFNFGEVVGAGAASGISSLYYPAKERSFGNTGQEWAVDIGIDALSYVGREFWPDVNRKVFHGKD